MNCLVVGAGLSGLASAWCLADAGVSVEVVDAAPGPGGLLQSAHPPEGLVESAARGFIWTERVGALFAAAGVEPAFARDDSKRRYIYRDGRPRRWPLGPGESLSLLLHAGAAAVTRRMRPRDGETVAVWSRRVLGRGGADWLIGPVLQGIYAAPADQVSATALFGPGRTRLRGKLAAPVDGMGALFDGLRRALEARGATIRFGAAVDRLDPDVPTIVATDAPAASRLIAPHAPRVAEALGRIRMTSVRSVTSFYPPDSSDVRGFGVLFPRASGIGALGVLFNADIFHGRGSLRSETWIYGDPDPSKVPAADHIAASVAADRRRFTGRDAAPVAQYPTRAPQRLPIYDDAVPAAVRALGDLPPWLALAGNYLGRLGISALVDVSREAAERVMAGRAQNPSRTAP